MPEADSVPDFVDDGTHFATPFADANQLLSWDVLVFIVVDEACIGSSNLWPTPTEITKMKQKNITVKV